MDKQKVHTASFEELHQAPTDPKALQWIEKNLALIKDVKVGVSARLGTAAISVSRLFELKDGEVLALDTMVDEPVDLLLEGKIVARGQIVVVDDAYGVRITEIIGTPG